MLARMRAGCVSRLRGDTYSSSVPSARMLDWDADQRLTIGETTFLILPADTFGMPGAGEGEFGIYKPRELVERHAALIEELEPQNIFELGIFGGGSTLFFAELARPRRLVAIDRLPLWQVQSRIESSAAASGLGEAVRIFGEVDQADRGRLREIADDAFDGAALDLVVDDCSHLYGPTRASFNELFPRIRPGGIYVIEDWEWAHTPVESTEEEMFPDEVPLTRLLFEITLAMASVPGLINEISVEHEAARISRGEAEVDPVTFDVSTCSNPRGRALLAPS
jgi:hypothetical protein